MGTEKRFIRSKMVLKKLRNYGNIEVFYGQGEERSSGFFAACTFARLRGGPVKLERKDFPSGPAQRVRMGRAGTEGLPDFHRDLGLMPNYL